MTERGVRMGGRGQSIRAVTHLDISRSDIEQTVETMRDVVVSG
jgi:threonine aldolase